MSSFICVMVCGLFEGSESVEAFFIVLYIYVLQLVIQLSRGECWDPINRFKPPNLCDCPKPGPGFPMSYVVDCLVLSEFS